MSKIYILGSVASGKTTLAKNLSIKTNIKHYELDSIIFDDSKKSNKKRSIEEQEKIINKINQKGSWIIEGTYRKSCHSVLDFAEYIIWLDPPMILRKIRILTRFIKQKLYIEKCNYQVNYVMLKSMYKWTKNFEQKREELENLLNNYENKLIIIKNSKQIKKFLEKL